MEKETRNAIERATQRARRLLEDDFASQLEGTFDVLRDGAVAAEAGPHLAPRQVFQRDKIVATIQHKLAAGMSAPEAVVDYLRDAAFTTLNRFAALKMLEAGELLQECITKGEQSAGYREFCGMAPGVALLPEGSGYRLYIESLFDELSTEVKVLFDRRSPASVLWPTRATFGSLLEVLNATDLAKVWGQDETIGWIYQFFNSGDERRKLRKASQAPRNSRELAIRNQFFTPRYVVQFLTDNTLGRLWYEMRGGRTALTAACRSLFHFPDDTRTSEAEDDDASATRISLRTKDPRDLKVLDPACGSGHFLLYAFDLLLVAYEEAWADPASAPSAITGRTLRQDFASIFALRHALPGLILRHNLYGVDIDPRAAQIAALALWMRGQRANRDSGIPRDERAPIAKTNIVVAEPMPGEPELLRDFTAALDHRLGALVERVFAKMRLAGLAGSLLKIEEDIQTAIREVYPSAGELFREADENTWRDAESTLLSALKQYAEERQDTQALRRRMFAEDAARGFAFIDICRAKYDVVLMNPPFGEFPKQLREERQSWYPNSWQDILAAFTERFFGRLTDSGRLGAITSRTAFFLPSLLSWRQEFLVRHSNPVLMADLGDQVMDSAMVESAAYVLARRPTTDSVPFIRLLGCKVSERPSELLAAVDAYNMSLESDRLYLTKINVFERLRQSPLAYWVTESTVRTLQPLRRFVPDVAEARQGLVTGDSNRFVRVFWEVPVGTIETSGDTSAAEKRWFPYVMRGSSQPWYSPITVLVNWSRHGLELRNFFDEKGALRSRPRAMEFYFRPGFSWTRRAVRFVPYAIPRGCIPSASRYMAFPPADTSLEALGIAASNTVSSLLRLYGEWFSRPNFLVEHLKSLPWAQLDTETAVLVREKVSAEIHQRRLAYTLHEPFEEFWAPRVFRSDVDSSALTYSVQSLLGPELDGRVATAFGLTPRESDLLGRDLREAIEYQAPPLDDQDVEDNQDDDSPDDDDLLFVDSPEEDHMAALSYLIGVAFGRWDLRLLLDPSLVPGLPVADTPLPCVPLGYLAAAQGDLKDYPIQLSQTGILVDDAGHRDDLVRATGAILDRILDSGWTPARAGQKDAWYESEALRLAYRTDFWDYHLRIYSRSKRRAPNYWLLSTPTGRYSTWLYYHRLTGDSLYRLLNDYVTPKLHHEERRLDSLRREGAVANSVSLRKDVGEQSEFVEELRAFRDEIALVAPLWNPNLNDGVLINFAPLWRLVPHRKAWQRELKATWDSLLSGDNDWSHLAMHLWPERVVPHCATDLSLAIAHGLEDMFWVEGTDGKWKGRTTPVRPVDELVRERSSAAVKAALTALVNAPTAAGTGRARRRAAPPAAPEGVSR